MQLAVEARELLAEKGIPARVVSMPCREWFDAQDAAYRETVLPPAVQGAGLASRPASPRAGARSSATPAGSSRLEHYGASRRLRTLFREFGITAAAVVDAAEDSIRVARPAGPTRNATASTTEEQP